MAVKKTKKVYSNAEVVALMDAFGKDWQTIKRWITKNDDRLTSDKAKEALAKINS